MKQVQIDENKLIEYHSQGLDCDKIASIFNCARWTISKRLKLLGLTINKAKRNPLTKETKLVMSEKRKEWIRNNPDKHPWRNHNKFKSVPCEKVKEWLVNNKIQFISEMEIECADNHTYSIDIAFPERKIGLEINGNQHYNRDGTLKPYYQQRENLIKELGWQLVQIHYSLCFNLAKIQNIVENVLAGKNEEFFNYKEYFEEKAKREQEKKTPKKCCDCGSEIHKYAIRCRSCASSAINKTRTKRCDKEQLLELVNKFPMTAIAKKFGVSGGSIKKWCNFYNITIPDRRGYWAKLQYGKTEPQIII